MNNLRKPYWLFIVITIPQLILASLYFASYRIISSLLTEENLHAWKTYGTMLGILFAGFTAYGIYASLKKKPVHVLAAVFILVFYIAFLYFYSNAINIIIPWTIPRWMLFEGDLQLYVYTFIMPALLYALFLIVSWTTPSEQEHRAWLNFIGMVVIPIGWYLSFQISSLFSFHRFEGFEHIIMLLFISSTVLFLFFLSRWVYILINRSNKKFAAFDWLWKILLAIIFPLLGLALNSGFFRAFEGAFGNFSSIWFPILALLNGILLCIPPRSNLSFRRIIFLLRSLTYPFTIYFFLVFLPWLPLSIVAIIAFGLGFLMLTPLALMVIHTQALSNDYNALKPHYSKASLLFSMVVGIIIIPGIIIIININDRINLHRALDYVYAPDLSSQQPAINTASIERSLQAIRMNKSNGRDEFLFDNSKTPYLSSLYDWQVLDNLTLSDSKIGLLENVFAGKVTFYNDENNWWWRTTMPKGDPLVKIDSVKTTSEYVEKDKLWKTQVDLAIISHAVGRRQQFSADFKLPDGCWISDYHLVVNGENKKGLLAEKQSAMWVYKQIVSYRMDPGILFYQRGNHISFNVFPLDSGEIRHTSIEFIHKEPMNITIDSTTIQLGNPSKQISISDSGTNGYITATQKAALPKVVRKPYYHFIADMSARSKNERQGMIKSIDQLLNRNLIEPTNAEITLTNYRTETLKIAGSDWKKSLKEFPAEGGFFAEEAISRALFKEYKEQPATYPVFILLTDSVENALFTGALGDMQFAYPETDTFYVLHPGGNLTSLSLGNPYRKISSGITDTFYVLHPGGNLTSHPLTGNSYRQISPDINVIPRHPAYKYSEKGKTIYLPVNNSGSYIIPEQASLDFHHTQNDKSLYSAMALQALWQQTVLHPEQAEDKWHEIIEGSFLTGIMTPVTSYIVVENKAQEQALLEKQKQVLSSKKSLDTDEQINEMSEPSLWLLLLLVLPILFYQMRNWKRVTT